MRKERGGKSEIFVAVLISFPRTICAQCMHFHDLESLYVHHHHFLSSPARYRVDIGGKPYTAITHYLHAISLDPTNGMYTGVHTEGGGGAVKIGGHASPVRILALD